MSEMDDVAPRNGVYLLQVSSIDDPEINYRVECAHKSWLAERVRVNDRYIAGDFELECDEFVMLDGVLHVRMEGDDE